MIKIMHIGRPVTGVGVYIHLLTKHINQDKFCNKLICNKNDAIIEPRTKSGDLIETFHADFSREINPVSDCKAIIQTIRILKKEKPDIVHCHSAKPGIVGRIAALLLKIKVIYTPHAYSYLSADSKFKKKFFFLIEKAFGYTSAKTLACSKSEYERAVNGLKINPKKVFLWNNSIEDKIITQKSTILEQLPNQFICIIGRPSYQKNIELLLESLFLAKKKIDTIHLVILGAGEKTVHLQILKDKIKEYNLDDNVTIIHWLERPKSLAVLEKSLFCISTSRYEGLPYSLIEAIALSKPCIVTNVDGNKDLIIDEFNGFLVSFNKEEIAKKIILLFKNQDLNFEMGNNSRVNFLKKYDITKNIIDLEKVYFQMI
jgi:glycosyltransferase involved in cell wall biosynthesis